MSRVLLILFNTEMVQAILDRRKTATRRKIDIDIANQFEVECDGKTVTAYINQETGDCYSPTKICKYQPGDILYVRETWQKAYIVDGNDQIIEGTEKYYYAAGPEVPCYDLWVAPHTGEHKEKMPWRPSIHMPKEAARIFLKVTDVKVEQLQDITEEQARAEGIQEFTKDENLYKYAVNIDWWEKYHKKHVKDFAGNYWQDMPHTAREAYSYLWNSTIKESCLAHYGWNANPWVWVIAFERCEKPEGWCV